MIYPPFPTNALRGPTARERIGMAWDALRGRQVRSFAGGDFNRLLADWIASCVKADDEIKRDFRSLRARARELGRNNPVARSYLKLLDSNVVGPNGFTAQVQLVESNGELADRVNTQIEEAWARWCENVTLDRRYSMPELLSLAVATRSREGELLFRKNIGPEYRDGLALQPIDADQLDDYMNIARVVNEPEVRMGVSVDLQGRRLGYWITDEPYSAYGLNMRRVWVPAKEIIHFFRPDRVHQTRGVTDFHACMVLLHLLGTYIETEVVASRIAAAKMIFFENVSGKNPGVASSDMPATMEATPGIGHALPIGWTAKAFDPAHPKEQFPSFVKVCLRLIASSLGVGYNTLANDLEGVSYSSGRTWTIVERDLWKVEQQRLVRQVIRPVFREWAKTAILSGSLQIRGLLPEHLEAVRFVPRGYDWVDPEADTNAAEKALQNGLTSRKRLAAAKGESFEDIARELAAEKKLLRQLGLEQEPATPEPDTAEDDEAPAGDESRSGRSLKLAR